MRTRLGQTLVCLFYGEDLTSKPKYNRHKLSSCSSDVVDKWKDVAEACAKEIDMNIELDKYVGDTTSIDIKEISFISMLLLSFVGTA